MLYLSSKLVSNNLIKVVAAIIVSDCKFLITCRPISSKHDPGLWEFPGGKVNIGEEPKGALIREIEEELGIEIKPLKIFSKNYFHKDDLEICLIFYSCSLISGKIKNIGVFDHRWIDISFDLSTIKFSKVDQKIAIKIQKALILKKV